MNNWIMSNKKPGYGNTVVCPYNKCHVVLKSRFQIHLSKCAKQHPRIQLETCPYDVNHKLRAEEIRDHIENCPSMETFNRNKAEEEQRALLQRANQRLATRITYYEEDCE